MDASGVGANAGAAPTGNEARPKRADRLRVLGIDPGTRLLGFGLVDASGSRFALVEAGCLRLDRIGGDLPAKLAAIHRRVHELITAWEPDCLALEEAFHGRSAQAAFRIGEARGAVLVAAAQAGVTIAQYPPATIKKAVTGNGRADKSQVGHMVARLLAVPASFESEDVSDALGVALCHALRAPRASVPSAAGVLPSGVRRPTTIPRG